MIGSFPIPRIHTAPTTFSCACAGPGGAPRGVRWFDVDLPEVVELRRELYAESDRYRMIAASVTAQEWLDEIPADRPVLIIAEGLLMYLREREVAQLLRRLTGRFSSGELVFDGIAPWGAGTTQLAKKHLSRWYPYPAFQTPTRDGSDIER